MKFKVSGVILLLYVMFVAVGCYGPTPKERFKDTGLLGEHSLVRIESFGAVQGSVSGGFFVGIGSVKSSLDSEFKIQFYWSPKPDEIIATALPYSKFRFIIDDSKDTPTIEFIFEDRWLNRKTDLDCGNPVRFPNLNDFVLDNVMELARVRISKTALEKEVYLPKIR